MRIKIVSMLVFSFLICSDSDAQIGTFNPEVSYTQYGPNDCLLKTTDPCSIDFMLKTFCLIDQPMCGLVIGTNQYYLHDALFLNKYAIFSGGTHSTISFSILHTYPEETLHEIFEYAICFSSPESCYPDGENGLTIYSDFVCRTTEEDDFCGGPTDSAVCEVTPEACSGNSAD